MRPRKKKASDGPLPTIRQMRGWGIALLHLSPDDLGRLRLPDYWSAMTAYSEQVQADRQHQGDLIRCATMMLINLQLKPKDRFKRVQDFWPMPWDPLSEDPGKAIRDMSDEERQSMYNDFLKRLDG